MPEAFQLPSKLKLAKWKVKIREKETVEPPHATVINGTKAWRWNLREKKFMDKEPPQRDVPKAIKKFLKEKQVDLIAAWDKKYPFNKVESTESI